MTSVFALLFLTPVFDRLVHSMVNNAECRIPMLSVGMDTSETEDAGRFTSSDEFKYIKFLMLTMDVML